MAGAVVGGTLSLAGALGADIWRDQRGARTAARLIFWELIGNLSVLAALNVAHDPSGSWALRRSAWDAGSLALTRIAGEGDVPRLEQAYASLELLHQLATVRIGAAPNPESLELYARDAEQRKKRFSDLARSLMREPLVACGRVAGVDDGLTDARLNASLDVSTRLPEQAQ